jgi:hypothetical protein
MSMKHAYQQRLPVVFTILTDCRQSDNDSGPGKTALACMTFQRMTAPETAM